MSSLNRQPSEFWLPDRVVVQEEPPGAIRVPLTSGSPPPPASALTFPAPTDSNFVDTGNSLGTSFQVTVPGSWVGVRILIAGTLPSGQLTAIAGGLAGAIEFKDFTGVAGTTMDVLFDTPIAVIPATNYTAGYYTADRYAYTLPPWPLTSPDGKIFTPAVTGGLFTSGSPPPVNPTTPTGLFFQCGPLVIFP